MSLATPVSVQKLQTALHAKAKEASGYRFYALYDKVYRKDVLAFAYQCCRANGGAAGADGQTFEDIEAYGLERWLDELAQAKPIERWNDTPAGGSASGCAPNTKCRAREPRGIPTTPCTRSLVWSGSHSGPPVFRGRHRVSLLREPDAVTPPVRFDERDVETEHGSASEAPADERAGHG
jgi:hypothetical protein